MSLLNKVGNMLTKKNITHKKDNNKYKPAGVHVLGEDYFSNNIIISEDSLEPDFPDNEKQPNVIISGSSNILPFIADHKSLNEPPNEQKQQSDKKIQKEDSDIARGFILMNGEKKFRTDNCFIKIDDNVFPCRVILTHFRVFIMPDFKKKNPNEFSYMNYFPDNFFNLFIHKIDKVVRTSNEKSFDYSLDIIMKDQRVFGLIFKNNSGVNFRDQLNGILALREHSYQNIAIEYRKNNPIYKKENFQDGWNLYNPEEEYARQGLNNLDYEVNRNSLFRKTKLNENYALCPSYPKFLITVGEITDSDYKCSAEFRTKNRLPALAYYDKSTGGTIWRSAQTKSGISGNRNRFDEDLLLDITKISKKKRLYIYDCRPYLSAVANKLKGAGYENTENYPGSEIFFCEIDNIHTARNALNKIYSMLKSNRFIENKSFFANFENSGWPSFIFGIILASINIASAVRKGYSVLIHCSDGWDRTTQLCCISQLILDKRYRTLDGFICLIEKDWLSFGHQFRYRCGMYCPGDSPSNVASENQKSPVFIQWLDAVYQIMQQNITKFEYNTDLLYFLASEMFTGKYGTFLFNNELEREKFKAREKTVSIWTYVKENEFRFINPIYNPDDNLPFVMNYKRVQLWNKYFFRFEEGDNCYDEKISKVFQDIKNTVSKDKKIINDLVSFINKKCQDADISGLTEECQNLIRRKSKVIKKK